ncbi:hypothetical protein PYW08_012249 [Mythimna loreyi]|uniref:Uncharacterized protein n=1 Tax=Mythimna loreyi TaxID=667449 RepID=A0ACC2Q4P1_9NEOP|nr:hypothetical protein PYW08_012249 [Mythimna loreyi]
MNQLRCYTCLELGRKLRPLTPYAKSLFSWLCPEMFFKKKDKTDFLICWECEYMVDKIKGFQNKLKQGNQILKMSLKPLKDSPIIIVGLSTQRLTKVEIISIPPQNLPQNQQILPQDQQILPQDQQILPKNPYLTINAQNILKLSLRDMLEAPPKLQTDTEVKIEAVDVENTETEFSDEATCSNDFDELIQPTTIQQISCDPLLVPLKNQPKLWAEIEVPPLPPLKPKPIKIEKPIPIPETPPDLFPMEKIPLRGSKERVKVTVKEPSVTMNLGNIEVTLPARKNDLLTKMLQNPSKGEDLFLMKQRISLPNSTNDPNSQPEYAEDEAKVIILNDTELKESRNKRRLNPLFVASQIKCEKCILRFQSQEKLDEHNLLHDVSQGNSICGVCEQRFPNENVLNDHFRLHFIMYECMKCPYRHNNRIRLSTHIRNKHEESCFYCKKCFQNFKTHKERRMHMIKVHDQKVACKECKKTFANATRLKAHIGVVHKSKTVPCPICKKKIKNYYLKNHVKTHADQEDNFYCVDCGTFYKNKYTYEQHLKNSLKHNTLENLGIKCDHCDKLFTSREALRNHVKEIGGVKFTCDICNKDCKSKGTLAIHISTVHHKIKRKTKPKICEVCGKSFTVRKSLVEHLNLHLGVRPHVCKDCGATFIYSAALFTHRRLVHKVKKKSEMKN